MQVAAYCRVSSSSADQLNSYANQIDYYTRLAKKKKNEWNMVEIFADEGISGMKAKNRPEFQRMIRMCELHQLDLIITKSVSRFARNVKEALEYVRKLKLLGVGIIFEKEGINTQSLGDEMLLNTFTAIAQEESKVISQNQRLSIVKRMELGIYVDSNSRSIETFNIFEHGSFREYVKKAARKVQSKEEFAMQLRREVMYYFWSKCEWEVLISPWVGGNDDEEIKVDVAWQIMNNWDVFVDYTWNNRKKL